MLFSKLKHKDEELLPPPPPFPSMELEEEKEPEILEKPEAKPVKAKTEDEFDDLFKEVESLKLEREAVKKERPKPAAKVKEKAKPVKVKPAKPLKETKFVKKLPSIKIRAKLVKPIKTGPKPLEGLEFPAELKEDFEFPELGEKELEFGSIGEIEAWPNELQEAKDEIKSAIEKIKQWHASERSEARSQLSEKPSLLQKLFARKEKQEVMEKPAADDVSAIKSYIENARQALMNFDLAAAKRDYIEIMKIYNKTSPEQQAKVYREINDLYSERKSAEELKVEIILPY